MGQETLLDLTLGRFLDRQGYYEPLIVANEAHRHLLPDGVEAILEPCAQNTAAAIAIACLYLQAKHCEGVAVFVPADHYITRADAFHKAVQTASIAAQGGRIATLGITPTFPATGYGYIQQGAEENGIYQISKFIEKPDIENAVQLLQAENYLWNSGIFVGKPSVFLAEIKKHAPAVYAATQKAFAACASASLETPLTFDKALYENIPSDSIDYAVMEHTEKGVVVPADMGWSDIGTWQSLWGITLKKLRCSGQIIVKTLKASYRHRITVFSIKKA
jgi:mannose-1-phosphate guanylyltransferase/mannose-6-phosphate isomerase